MDVLLIWNNGQNTDMKVLVNLHTKTLRDQVERLMAEGRDSEAFRLIVKKAAVKTFIPPGQKIRLRPRLTLVEDLV
ncbi:MAG: hypothetical protein HQL23_09155 [Candidatus Omnitrophica bacterium]|nr:hypothetical protein [Candidatus Omnitrophota bacterium]